MKELCKGLDKDRHRKGFRCCAEIKQEGQHKVKNKTKHHRGFSLSIGHLAGIQEVSKIGGKTGTWQLQQSRIEVMRIGQHAGNHGRDLEILFGDHLEEGFERSELSSSSC